MKEAGINVMPPTVHPERDMRAREGFAIQLTKTDWQRGIRNDPQRCAAARSERRAGGLKFSGDDGVWIGKRHARVTIVDAKSPTGYRCLRCSHNANRHIKRFDAGEDIFPVMVKFSPIPHNDKPEAKRQREKREGAHTAAGGVRRNSTRISLVRGKIVK